MADRSQPPDPGDSSRATLSWPGQPTCRYCGTPLDRLRAGIGRCGGAECETRHQNEAARAVYKQRWDEYVDRLRAGIDGHGPELLAGARDLETDLADLHIGVVPRVERPIVPMPEARKAAFMAHVEKIAAESYTQEPPDTAADRRIHNEPSEPGFMTAACVACQGHCCVLGADSHAFLNAPVIDAVRLRNPGITAEEVIARYRDAIPDESVEGSCIYHGPMGCVMDRTWRADLCNSFQCNGKRRTIDRMRDAGTTTVLWIADERGSDVSAVMAYDDAGGFRTVTPDPGAGDTEPARVAEALEIARAGLPEKLPELARPVVAPPGQACSFCGAPIDANRARTTGTCGSAACEHARAARGRA